MAVLYAEYLTVGLAVATVVGATVWLRLGRATPNGIAPLKPWEQPRPEQKPRPSDITTATIPLKGEGNQGKLLKVLDNVFSAAECQELCSRIEAQYETQRATDPKNLQKFGPRFALLTSCEEGTAQPPEEWLREQLWERVAPHLPQVLSGGELVGLPKSRLLLTRYTEGERLKGHRDTFFIGPAESRSLVTLQLYLSENFEGGRTRFCSQAQYESTATQRRKAVAQSCNIAPRVGRVAVFEHSAYHMALPVKGGVKYGCRADVLYGGPGLVLAQGQGDLGLVLAR
eukprot:TRINITY_DN29080_c0_g1_i3.p1 TRINITY_DN29080_c0_g1~~TRINITY_DN29080_c0_g1_i3.p1  ORF type:complete len:285 (-),score=54.47 TRINITY_DN29080_c0_g1_i3:310-1164(-)